MTRIHQRASSRQHDAIQEKKDGKVVDWMEQVSDEQYHPEK